MKRAALALAAVVLLYAAPARARTPEIALDPRDGVWIAQDDKFIFQTLDRWTVFDAGATVNKLVVDQTILWLATDDGVIRFDIGSQRFTKLTMDDGLPSQRVSTVAFDDQYVWFGTNKGLVRYRKTDRALKVYDESNGLPSKVVTYSVSIGRQVWFGTRAGIAVFSPDVDGLRAFGEADGMASGDVAELFQFGNDLWCRTDVGLSRFRIQQRVFNNFPMTLMRAQQIRVITIEGENLWLGTDNGLWQFEGASDAIRIFPQQAALGSQTIVGVETTSSFLYFTTDKEILQYNKLTLGIRRFTSAEGLRRQEGSTGTLSSAKFVTVMFSDAAVVYNIQLDQWTERKIEVTVANERKTTGRIFGQLELEQPYINGTRDTSSAYANAIGGIGIGQQLEKDRTLNGSVYLDYGQLNAGGIRDLQYKIEYLGNQNDVVRDVRIEDKLKYRYVEEGLDRQLLLQGAHVGMATPGAEPKAKLEVDVGFRRGQVVRDFLTGPWQEIYQLSQKYILSGTERVYVDGELLNNGTDYTIIYSSGQLTFLDRERIDDLSVITIEYERDLVPKKSLGALSLQARLPATNEIGTWALSGTPVMISTDTGLYAQIDGAAPKYIDHFWLASVFATYQQGGSSISVQIHKMASPQDAEDMFNLSPPPSYVVINKTDAKDPHGVRPNAEVDMSLQTAYQARAFSDQFFIEVSIDDHSDAALIYVKTFTLQILNRATQAGSSVGDQFKEMLVATRAAVSPVKGMEIGARAAQLEQMSDSSYVDNGNTVRVPASHLTTGAVDGRYQSKVGEGGLLTSYAEMGGSHDSNGDRPDGLAGMGFMRLSSSRLEGTISGRMNSEGWTPIGHTTPSLPEGGLSGQRTWNDARLGTLRDQAQFNVTGYPLEWLPVTALFTRQRAWLTDGSEGTGVIQHVIARIQLNKAGLPATTLQFGSTELDNPNAFQTHRLQGSAQTDYDLARVLSFTHIKRFNIRALYSLSQAETDQNGKFAYGDRVHLVRLEGKLSPTSTESINALFRSRDVERQTDVDGPYRRSVSHWELVSSAQSTIIPGLVPKLNYNLFYDDNRMPSSTSSSSSTTTTTTTTDSASAASTANLWANTGSAGSAITPPGPGPLILQSPTRTVTGTIGGALGIYPGQWWPKLGPLAFSPSIAVGDSEKSVDFVKTEYGRVYDFVGSEVWAGRKLELSFYQRYRYTLAGFDAHESDSTTVLQNRIVYRPIFTSPITLLANYEGDRKLNVDIPNAGPWSNKSTYQNTLEWLNRWSQVFTTRTRAYGNLEHTTNTYTSSTDSSLVTTYTPSNHDKYSLGGEVQFRFYPLADVSALYIYATTAFYRIFCNGGESSSNDSFQAWQLLPATGVIWRLGDKIYLDGHFNYDYLHCMSGAYTACTTTAKISPYVYFTMNL